ncbi:hypothetical protein DFH28DRAFT_894663 [Melampsora americana]|nr:hypothetical protein DFH28DRAFT_894663 [Melampsora americana]
MEEYHVRIGLVISKTSDQENEGDSDEIEMMMMVDRILDLASSFVRIFKNVEDHDLSDVQASNQTGVMERIGGKPNQVSRSVPKTSVPKTSVSREQVVKKAQKKKDSIKSGLDKKSK